jgi:hypothetical protein
MDVDQLGKSVDPARGITVEGARSTRLSSAVQRMDRSFAPTGLGMARCGGGPRVGTGFRVQSASLIQAAPHVAHIYDSSWPNDSHFVSWAGRHFGLTTKQLMVQSD